MNLQISSVAKWFVAFATCLSVAMGSYNLGHKGPPVTYADWWDFTYVLLLGVGGGALGRGVNVGIQKVKDNKSASESHRD